MTEQQQSTISAKNKKATRNTLTFKWGRIRRKGSSFQVILKQTLVGPNGNRFAGTFKTQAEAAAEGERKLRIMSQHGTDVLKLSPSFLRAATEAQRILTEKGFQDTAIIDAVVAYCKENDSKTEKRLIADVCDEYLKCKQNVGLRAATLKGYRQKYEFIKKHLGNRFIHETTASDIEAWYDRAGFKLGNKRELTRHISMLYAFAIKRKYVKENIGKAITAVKRQIMNPAILTPLEVRKLLLEAKEHNMGRMVPYFAIAAFCGVRPDELKRVTWGALNFAEKTIYLSSDIVKVGSDRYVDMPDCLIEWLAMTPEENRREEIYYSRTPFDKIKKRAGVKWQADILRHSAASHLYAKTQNAAHCTAQMGHGLHVFLKYYKKTVTQKQGQEYFEVRPTDKTDNAAVFAKAEGA